MYINLGVGWYNKGNKKNFNSEGIDESVWICNQDKNKELPKNLYLLKDCKNIDVFKVGMSNNSFVRCRFINSNCRGLHKFKVQDEIFINDTAKSFAIEQAILSVFKDYRLYKKNNCFGGSSEVLKIDKNKIVKVFASLRNLR